MCSFTENSSNMYIIILSIVPPRLDSGNLRTKILRTMTELQRQLCARYKSIKEIRETFNPWVSRDDNTIANFSTI